MATKRKTAKLRKTGKQGQITPPAKDNALTFYAKYITIGSVVGVIGYKYIRSIVDFREEAKELGIEVRATSDLIWMFIATYFHHLMRTTFKNLLEEPLKNLVEE